MLLWCALLSRKRRRVERGCERASAANATVRRLLDLFAAVCRQADKNLMTPKVCAVAVRWLGRHCARRGQNLAIVMSPNLAPRITVGDVQLAELMFVKAFAKCLELCIRHRMDSTAADLA